MDFLDSLVGKTSFSSSIFNILGLIIAKLYFSSLKICVFESLKMLYAVKLLVCAKGRLQGQTQLTFLCQF